MIKTYEYENGLTLIVNQIYGLFSVACGIGVGTGSINETENNNGISHFIEHMNFKGTKTRSSFDISNQMETLGTNFNAFTSTNVTSYYVQSVKENIEKSVEILCDLTYGSIYPKDETEKEKDVICEEINMSEDTPEDVCMDLAEKAFYGDNGYGRTILGPEKNVRSFDKKIILSYLENYYVAENTVICFSGNIDFDLAKKITDKYLIPIIRSGKKQATPLHNIESLKQNLSRNKDIEQSHICLQLPSQSYLDESRIVNEMTCNILGGGMSSRLFQKVREELGLAYSVYSFSSRYKDTGNLSIYAGVNSDKTEMAFEAVTEVISDLIKNGVTEDEFIKAKAQAKANTVFSKESSTAQMQLYSKYYLLTGKIFSFENRLSLIDKVTISDVNEDIKKINLSKLATAVVGKNVKALR